jgi:hypothetical protein
MKRSKSIDEDDLEIFDDEEDLYEDDPEVC